MKKIYSTLFIILSLISFNLFASITDYNNGYTKMSQLLSSTASSDEAYGIYLRAIKSCSLISSTTVSGKTTNIYHAGDSRFVNKAVCHEMLGMYDRFHGTSTPLSHCDREAVPSDVAMPSDLGTSGTCSIEVADPQGGQCPARTFTDNIGTATVQFDFPSGYSYDTQAAKQSNNEGDSCAVDAEVSCIMIAECDRGTKQWQTVDTQCNCVPTSEGGPIGGNVCTGSPPPGTGYCRCGRWVSWKTFSSTYEC